MLKYQLLVIFASYFSINCQDAPKISPFTFPPNPVIGRTTLVYCLTEIGTPPIKYQWSRNNQLINSNDGITLTVEPVSNALGLVIQSVSPKHSANYTCVASNPFGEDSFTAQLNIKGPPIWVNTSSDYKARSGSDIELQCSAEGFPTPLIKWTKKDGQIR